MFMLHTNICIYVLKKRDQRLRAKFKVIKDLVISSMTYAELCFGIENGAAHLRHERYRQLHMFLYRVQIDAWGEDAGLSYGRVRAALKRDGALIGNNDLLIAAHALSMNAVLITNNEKEFNRVAGLQIENWLSE